jgi:hypothetical protein
LAFPEYEEMVEPLLCFIYFNGGQNFAVRPRDTYKPLANFFKLTEQDRMQSRHDGRPGKEWDNKVQWTRQKLINDGEFDGTATRGIWRLSQKGLGRAKSVCSKYESLRKTIEGRRLLENYNVPPTTETFSPVVKAAPPPLEPAVDVETRDNEFPQSIPQSPTPIAADIAEPPTRVLTKTYRILRDTKLVIEIKESHGFQCQVCHNPPLKLSDVKLYAEGHHIKPLGSPHDGPDVRENILCVFPNCHVLLDYGAIELHLDRLSTSANHMIGGEYVDYHNCQIFRKVEIAP